MYIYMERKAEQDAQDERPPKVADAKPQREGDSSRGHKRKAPSGTNFRSVTRAKVNAATVTARLREEALQEAHLARMLSQKSFGARTGSTASERLCKVRKAVLSKGTGTATSSQSAAAEAL